MATELTSKVLVRHPWHVGNHTVNLSTCHVILDNKLFDKLEPACEEEEDMLDLAYGLTPTSRLGCQVK